MKAVRGYSKEYYRDPERAPIILEFTTIDAAAKHLAEKHGHSFDYMKLSVLDDTNCDAIFFDDGTVILYEF